MSWDITANTLIDGVAAGPFTSTVPDNTAMRFVWFGAYASGPVNDYDIRNPKVGTTAYGSSNVWNPTVGATIVPPFDSVTGDTAAMTASGGVITVDNAGSDVVAKHDLGADYYDLYFSFELRVRSAMLGITTADFMDFANQADAQLNGLFFDDEGWWFNGSGYSGDPEGSPPVADEWTLVQMHSVIAVPVVPGFTVSQHFSP